MKAFTYSLPRELLCVLFSEKIACYKQRVFTYDNLGLNFWHTDGFIIFFIQWTQLGKESSPNTFTITLRVFVVVIRQSWYDSCPLPNRYPACFTLLMVIFGWVQILYIYRLSSLYGYKHMHCKKNYNSNMQ